MTSNRESVLTTPQLDEDVDHTPHLMEERTSRAMKTAKRTFGLILALAVVGTVASVVAIAVQQQQQPSHNSKLTQASTGSGNSINDLLEAQIEAQIEAKTFHDTAPHMVQKHHSWTEFLVVDEEDNASYDNRLRGSNSNINGDDNELDYDGEDPFDCDDDDDVVDDDEDPFDCDDDDDNAVDDDEDPFDYPFDCDDDEMDDDPVIAKEVVAALNSHRMSSRVDPL
ncbi:hypothetical protein H257_09443 [Aphanomyces astaci]|uniref:Uncharacterized protein n=1 Tax=Aphanomyces astaci TaxID=112090 RepID=W4GBG2_APHAT|nr:hypothetical protein H257_09443 [Aphanomyces astaci]ETV76414.1 hypothetical protein H257_09443 [Aphanomyces astaci]|eukprot:XP_009833959.1 hypothetical protein H257_09443 [Aphanomyces astaci]